MRSPLILVTALAAGFAAPASAIVVNENVFTSNGGQLSNIPATIATAYTPMQAASRANPFYTVGDLGHCSATWLGDRDGYAWFLTSAQCVADRNTPMQAVVMRFVDWQGTVIADGQGWRYLPPQRIEVASGLPLAATDIALVKLPSKATIRDAAGNPVAPARLYSGANERTRQTTFIGHGTWGVGTQQNSHWSALDGSRRVLGRTMVDAYRDADHTLAAGYFAKGVTTRTARTSAGDGGVPWWQQHDGVWAVAGTTHANTNTQSHATRVSPYVPWILSTFPDAHVYSDAAPSAKLTDATPYVSQTDAQLTWSIPAGQPGVQGFTGEILTQAGGFAEILVDAKDRVTGATRTVRLRATRQAGGPLEVRFDPSDNAALPSGDYRAVVAAQAMAGSALTEYVRIGVEVFHGVRASVTKTAGYQSPNLSLATANGNSTSVGVYSVYFLVPAAQGSASGPTGRVWWGNTGQHTKIQVQATKDGATQPVTVTLRGDRHLGCGLWVQMHDAVTCTNGAQQVRQSNLRVTYHAADNPELPPGRYRGLVYIEAKGWSDSAFREVFAIDVDINTN